MASAVVLRSDFSAADLRRLAARGKDANQSWRLLSLAAVRDGMNRTAAARIGGMDRQTLRDWVIRFNEGGADALIDRRAGGTQPRLSAGGVGGDCRRGAGPGGGWRRALHGVLLAGMSCSHVARGLNTSARTRRQSRRLKISRMR